MTKQEIEIPIYADFMCDCKPEGKATCQEVLEAVYRDLETSAETLFTDVVYALTMLEDDKEQEYSGTITGIYADMWSRIDVTIRGRNSLGDYGDVAKIAVQCDKIEHGIARVWQFANDFLEGREPVKRED